MTPTHPHKAPISECRAVIGKPELVWSARDGWREALPEYGGGWHQRQPWSPDLSSRLYPTHYADNINLSEGD